MKQSKKKFRFHMKHFMNINQPLHRDDERKSQNHFFLPNFLVKRVSVNVTEVSQRFAASEKTEIFLLQNSSTHFSMVGDFEKRRKNVSGLIED